MKAKSEVLTTKAIAACMAFISNRVVSWNITAHGETVPICALNALPLCLIVDIVNAIREKPKATVIRCGPDKKVLLIVRPQLKRKPRP